MTLHNEIQQQLGQIAKRSAPPPHDMTISLSQGTLQCAIASVDAIGCAVDSLRLSLVDQDCWDLQRMRTLADHLCKQLRYLVEPLQVIEVDPDQPLVQA